MDNFMLRNLQIRITEAKIILSYFSVYMLGLFWKVDELKSAA